MSTAAALRSPHKRSRAPALAGAPSLRPLSAGLFGGGFLAAAFAVAFALSSARAVSPLVAAGLVAAYALAFRLDFEVGAGSAVPTQLVLVPMLFVLPLGAVPLAVAGGILLASLVDVVHGRIELGRLLPWLGNGLHAFGPAVVLAVAGESAPHLAHWPLYAGALAAQFALDFAVAG